jgi:DNA-binding MarR family transcriptional regulator
VSNNSSPGEEAEAATTPSAATTASAATPASAAAPKFDPPPEPDPFTAGEFGAWRGMLRVHATIFRALDQRLTAEHGFGVDAYGVLVTLVTDPDRGLTIGQLGERRNLSPSGISRSVDRLSEAGLVERRANPADGRSLLVALTPVGLERLRAAQVTHHATVRELLFARLGERDVKRLAQVLEKAMPGAVSSPVWPV